LKKKTGVFVVLKGETFQEAYDKHYDGYTDVEHVKKDMKAEAEGTQFELYTVEGEIGFVGAFEVKDGEVVKKDE
jgi:hypothetical protein